MPGIIGLHDHLYYQQRDDVQLSQAVHRRRGDHDPHHRQPRFIPGVESSAVGRERRRSGARSVSLLAPIYKGHPSRSAGCIHSTTPTMPRLVRYWSEEGVQWFKAYTTITHDELAAAIDEAHKYGIKVTGHLCSIGFREAVSLASTISSTVTPPTASSCPASNRTFAIRAARFGVCIDRPSKSAVQQTIKEIVAKKVAMTSTLAVEELSSATRVPRDQRVLDALNPESAKNVKQYYDSAATRTTRSRASLKKAMEFEREFVKAGGLLGAGSDPAASARSPAIRTRGTSSCWSRPGSP